MFVRVNRREYWSEPEVLSDASKVVVARCNETKTEDARFDGLNYRGPDSPELEQALKSLWQEVFIVRPRVLELFRAMALKAESTQQFESFESVLEWAERMLGERFTDDQMRNISGGIVELFRAKLQNAGFERAKTVQTIGSVLEVFDEFLLHNELRIGVGTPS